MAKGPLGYVLSTLEGLDCPRAVTLAIMARAGMWREALELPCNPVDYDDAERYFAAAQANAVLSKLDGIPGSGPRERKQAAVAKWLKAEQLCAATNARLSPFLEGMADTASDERIHSFIGVVRKKLEDILGESPPSTWEGRFGPGATVSDNSAHCTVPDKISSVPSFTPNAIFHLVPWSGTLWAEHSAAVGISPESVRGNVYFTVPKNSLTDRSCAKEPSINGFYQLGLGSIMKRRLRDAGIDLYEGKLLHMLKACEASLTGRFATIDLSSASDTVARNLVKLLLPPRWYRVLSSLRSPTTMVDGTMYFLEKFSSMGNGFTFELETAIFAALVSACCPGETLGDGVLIYGDDIIVPSEYARDVVACLRYFGFVPNATKTFLAGPFRESCGGDFWLGVPVRPHFQEEIPSEPQHVIALLNGWRRAARGSTLIGVNPVTLGRPVAKSRVRLFQVARSKLFRTLPSHIARCRGPEVLGDLVIHDDKWVTSQRWRSSGIAYLRVYRPVHPKVARENGFADSAILAAAVYGAQTDRPWVGVCKDPSNPQATRRFPSPSQRGFPLRGVSGYKLGWVACS